ncbi:QcrA and Rieske domain-containing protein [Jatrophihabitans endophyticus]|uniref:QcrA and Rieske domain-containing protein n=1 Tax=Jatrophihabitans endophyticus TaxID=1206085 RepID=UPI001F208C70|nr:Rieske (2Fe-2S) protein [Jatrophihabitans endophyticus]
MTRRTLLVAGAATAGAAALAACSGGSDGAATDDTAEAQTPTAGASTASTPARRSESSDATTSSSAPSTSSAAAAASLATLADITVGESVAVKLPNGKPGVVTRTSQTAAVCFSAVCTHQGCTVKPDGKQFTCPCHNSTFDAATGKVLGGPAPSALPKVTVKVVGGEVVPG